MLYDLSDLVAGAFAGVPSNNKNFDPLQGSVTVKLPGSRVTAQEARSWDTASIRARRASR